jgi:hypothetical protein
MTYKKSAEAWLDSAPKVDIHVGKFTLTYQYSYDRDWGMGWLCQNDLDWEDTPESNYYNELCHALESSCHNTCFIDDVLEAMKKTPFPMDWSKTHAEWDGEDWLFYNVPPEAGWASGQTCFSERELGECATPERAVRALKAYVYSNN